MSSGASSSSSSSDITNDAGDVVFEQVKNAAPTTTAQIIAWILVLEVNKTKLMGNNVDQSETNAFKGGVPYKDTFDCERASHALDLLHKAAEVV